MNIDERLESLAARHEALTQTVEIIAAMQRENEKHLASNDQQIAQLTALLAETGQFINRLAHIAETHQQRLDNLEER